MSTYPSTQTCSNSDPPPVVSSMTAPTAVEAVENLFDEVGFEGWNRPIDELITLFEDAVDELVVINAQRRLEVMSYHNNCWWLIRRLRELTGYRAPRLLTREVLIDQMINKLLHFSQSAKQMQQSSFFRHGDLTAVVQNTRWVAEALASTVPPYPPFTPSAHPDDL